MKPLFHTQNLINFSPCLCTKGPGGSSIPHNPTVDVISGPKHLTMYSVYMHRSSPPVMPSSHLPHFPLVLILWQGLAVPFPPRGRRVQICPGLPDPSSDRGEAWGVKNPCTAAVPSCSSAELQRDVSSRRAASLCVSLIQKQL